MGESDYQQLIDSDPNAVAKLLVEKDREIEKLRNHLLNAQRAQYGTKSERVSPDTQEPLFALEELTEPAVQEELLVVPAYKRSAKRRRREIPQGTIVKRIEHEPIETTCSCCGKGLSVLREEETKILNYIPARFELECHVRPVMACTHCKQSAPKATPLPAGIQLIPRSPAGVALLSSILLSKYQDHLPLHRQEVIFARLGYELPRSRMCEWLGHLAELLHPLYKAEKELLLKEPYLQGDETPVKIQDGETEDKCHQGYFWALSPPAKKLVFYHYAPTRAGEVPRSLLSGFKGILQTDLYAGYNEVYVPEETTRAGCWAHVRRKFISVQKLSEKELHVVLSLISKLYHAEPKDRAPKVVLAARTKHSTEIVSKLHLYLIEWSKRTLPRSEVQKAIQYALSQWEALTLFLTNPMVELDNNLIENQMRPIALGRKNWLFAGSHEGAMRAAIFFSLINSARMNKVNTWLYFNHVLPRLAHAPKGDELTKLLPHLWKPFVKDGD